MTAVAPSIRGSTAPVAGGTTTSPAGTEIGDCVIVFHWERAGAGIPTFTLDSGNGYIEIRNHSHNDGSTDGRLAVGYKIATAAGAQSYQAYTTSTGSPVWWAGCLVLSRDTFPASLGTVPANSVTATGTGAPDPPAVTGLEAASAYLCVAIAAWHLASSLTLTPTVPSGYSNLIDVAGAATGDVALATRVQTGITTEDAAAWADDQTPNGTCGIAFAIIGLQVAAVTETMAGPVTDAGLALSQLTQAEGLPIPVAESVMAVVTGQESAVAEDLPTGLAETTALVGPSEPISATEPLATALAEAAAAVVTGLAQAGVDMAAMVLSELHRDLAEMGVEGLPLAIVEAQTEAVTVLQPEALPLPLAGETGLVADVSPATPIAGAEGLPMAAVEAQAVASALILGEVLPSTLLEASASPLVALRPADSLPATLLERQGVFLTLTLTEPMPAALIEVMTPSVTATQAEAIALALVEVSAVLQLAAVAAADSLPLTIGERQDLVTFGQLTVTSTESLAVALEAVQAAIVLAQRLDAIGVGLVEARALAIALLQAEAASLTLLDRLEVFQTQAIADNLGLTLDALQAALLILVATETLALPLIETAAALLALGALDSVGVMLGDAQTAITALVIAVGTDEVSISLRETSAILPVVTQQIGRVITATVESRMLARTVDMVIRAWEVEVASPFPYTMSLV